MTHPISLPQPSTPLPQAHVASLEHAQSVLSRADGRPVLLSIVGPPRVGKSTFALHLAQALHAAGTTVIQLAAQQATPSALTQLMKQLSTTAPSGSVCFLVDDTDDLQPSLLITSADLLLARGNVVLVRRRPLGTLEEAITRLPLLSDDDAAELFERSAAQRNISTSASKVAIANLTRKLDHLPEAVILLAQQLEVYSFEQVNNRFEEIFEVAITSLHGKERTLKQELEAAIETLTERTREVLTLASLFHGAVEVEMLSSLLGRAITGDITELVARSLLIPVSRTHEAAPRAREVAPAFRTLASVSRLLTRSIAAENPWRLAHAQAFLERGRILEQKLASDTPGYAVELVDAELPNFKQAIQTFLEHKDTGSAARLTVLVAHLFLRTHRAHDAATLIEDVLSSSSGSALSPSARANLRIRLGAAQRHAGRFDEWRKTVDTAELESRHANDDATLTNVFLERMLHAFDKLAREAGREYMEQALRYARRSKNPVLEVNCLSNFARIELYVGNPSAAKKHADAAEVIAVREGTREEQLYAMLNGVMCDQALGRIEAARSRLTTAETLSAELGRDTAYYGEVLRVRGVFDHVRGNLDGARAAYVRSFEHQKEVVLPRPARTLISLACVEYELGNTTAAVSYLSQATFMAQQSEATFLLQLARAIGIVFRMETEDPRVIEAEVRELERDEQIQRLAQLGTSSSLPLLRAVSILASARDTVREGRLEDANKARDEVTAILESVRELVLPWTHPPFTFLMSRVVSAARKRLLPETAQRVLHVSALPIRWFAIDEGPRKPLRTRTALRNILEALIEARRNRAGEGIRAEALLQLAWPGADASTVARVHMGIKRLRDMGLADVLIRRHDGYMIDQSVELRFK